MFEKKIEPTLSQTKFYRSDIFIYIYRLKGLNPFLYLEDIPKTKYHFIFLDVKASPYNWSFPSKAQHKMFPGEKRGLVCNNMVLHPT